MDKAIELYKSGLSVQSTAKELGLDWHKLYRYLKPLGIIRSNKINSRKYTLNNGFFSEIKTEHQAYWLGFLYADGYVCQNTSQKMVGLALGIQDKQHMEKYKIAIKATYPIKKYISKSFGKEIEYIRLLVNSEGMYNDLINKGLAEHKTLTLQFPSCVPDSLLHHFIRGYFDGDGSFSKASKGYTFKVCGTKEFLNTLATHIGHPNPHLYQRWPERQNNNYNLEIGGRKQVAAIGDYVYKDATIYLERKHKRYIELKT